MSYEPFLEQTDVLELFMALILFLFKASQSLPVLLRVTAACLGFHFSDNGAMNASRA